MSLTTFSGPVVSQNGFIDSSFTDAERDAIVNPQPGLLIYNTTSNVYQVCTVGGGTPTWDTAFAVGITYTQGTDYSSTGLRYNNSMGTPTLLIDTSLWSTSTATLRAEPSGSVYYFITGGISYTFTSATAWTNTSGTTWQLIGTTNAGALSNVSVSSVTFQTPAVVPNITTVSPSSGAVGTSVTITGTGFNGTTGVTIGGISSTITASSNTQIVVTSPASTPSTAVDVVVTNSAGSSTSVAAFTNTTTSITYSVPTDYNNSMGNGVTADGSGTLSTLSFRWTNTAGLSNLTAQPSGTVYTVVTSGGTYTGTQSGPWSVSTVSSVSIVWDAPGFGSLAVTSITF